MVCMKAAPVPLLALHAHFSGSFPPSMLVPVISSTGLDHTSFSRCRQVLVLSKAGIVSAPASASLLHHKFHASPGQRAPVPAPLLCEARCSPHRAFDTYRSPSRVIGTGTLSASLPHNVARLGPMGGSCASLAGEAWGSCCRSLSPPPPGSAAATLPTMACPPA
jgi:hypothetical protein